MDTYSPTSVTFAVGETSKSVRYRLISDAVPEADETIVLEAYGVSGAAVLAGNANVLRSSAWILDDDGAGNKRALFVSNPVILEGDGGSRDAVFEVSLSRPATSSFTVDYRTVDGTALAGEDYAARSGEITFSVGQSLASVRVPVLGDGKVEAAESISSRGRRAGGGGAIHGGHGGNPRRRRRRRGGHPERVRARFGVARRVPGPTTNISIGPSRFRRRRPVR